jgi:zinc transporter, ZIP family
VSLIDRASATLLVAIFLSNLPESIVGAQKMRAAGFTPSRIMLIWSATSASNRPAREDCMKEP